MKVKNPLHNRVLSKISRSDDSVFVTQDFTRISGDDRQLRRALKQLVDEGKLVRIGHGVYAKTRVSSLSGKVIPDAPLPQLVREALPKLGTATVATELERGYQAGEHAQVSSGHTIGVTGRISRTFNWQDQVVSLEKAKSRN